MVGQVRGDAVRGGFHGVFALFPVGRADLAVFFGELEGFEDAQGFVDVSSEREVVDEGVSDNAFLVDKEEAAKGDGLVEE